MAFEIVAHRGIAHEAPENTLPAFERAVELGADSVELDVRLTSDRVPVVYHYFYLNENTAASGAIFNFTLEQLRRVRVFCRDNPAQEGRIPTLVEVLKALGGGESAWRSKSKGRSQRRRRSSETSCAVFSTFGRLLKSPHTSRRCW